MLKGAIGDGDPGKEAPVLAGETGTLAPGPRIAQPGPCADSARRYLAPVLRVDRNGILEDANDLARTMMGPLECRIGERLPDYITQLIPGVLLSGRKEKALIDVERKKQPVIVTMWCDPEIDQILRAKGARPLLVLVDDEESEYSALRALPVALYTTGSARELGETWVSPGVEELTGFPPSYFMTGGGFWVSRIHPDDRPHVARGLKELSKNGKVSLEYRFLCSGNNYKWILDHIVHPPGLNKGFGIMQNIDDRKRSELAADNHSDFLNLLVEGSAHGIIILDDEKCMVYMNLGLAERLGFSAADWVSRRTPLKFHPADSEAGLEAISAAMRGDRGSCRVRILGPGGACIHLQMHTAPIQWNGRRFVECSAQDLSEQIQAEQERTACIHEGLEELIGAAVAALAPGTSGREALAMMRRHLGEKGNALLESFGGKDG